MQWLKYASYVVLHLGAYVRHNRMIPVYVYWVLWQCTKKKKKKISL